jgi:hypothetical protein
LLSLPFDQYGSSTRLSIVYLERLPPLAVDLLP